jgi:hypothetical protein
MSCLEPEGSIRIRYNGNGYEYFSVIEDGECHDLNYHRLLASIDVHPEDMEGKEVHHKDGTKCWNYRDNLEVVTPEEHRQIHAAD